ncbi:hypothetical protein [Hymenobacter rubripertinctus]|uniref:Uncharacterized protein n=1 Tax=Hymenobacter rubripertinctus TaxID=2029981 RepID=A0A418R0W3_9BACT|nr:hypothetical protein [Hymenobacter rubripertinctus]RIY11063.1 hypothetical protein D0T11_08630 [Hymenobacter rubripertinctus]
MLRFIPLLALLAACESAPDREQQQVAAAEKTVLASHDSLMARMDRLYELRQQLARVPATDSVAAGRHRRALLGAESGMMFWMHHYRRPADTVAAPRRRAYYAAQQQRIDSVRRLFQRSQDSARQLLGATPAAPSTPAP